MLEKGRRDFITLLGRRSGMADRGSAVLL